MLCGPESQNAFEPRNTLEKQQPFAYLLTKLPAPCSKKPQPPNLFLGTTTEQIVLEVDRSFVNRPRALCSG